MTKGKNSPKAHDIDSSMTKKMQELRNEVNQTTLEETKKDHVCYTTKTEQAFFQIKCYLEEFLRRFFNESDTATLKKCLPESLLWGKLLEVRHEVDHQLYYKDGREYKSGEKQLHYFELRFTRCIQRVYIIMATDDNDVNFSFTKEIGSAQFRPATLILGLFEKELKAGIIHPYVINVPTLKELIEKKPKGVVEKDKCNTNLYLVDAKMHFDELPCYIIKTQEIINKEKLMQELNSKKQDDVSVNALV